MLRPSYTELMDIVNQDAETDNKITSRYSIVIAAAKRARQIIDGAPYNAPGVHSDKAVTIAIDEMRNGRIKIDPEGFKDNPEDSWNWQAKLRTGRHVPNVSLGADSASSEGALDMDYGDEMDDDELFEDESEPVAEKAEKERFGYRDGEYPEETFDEDAQDYSDEYDYEGDEMDDDYDYGDGDPK